MPGRGGGSLPRTEGGATKLSPRSHLVHRPGRPSARQGPGGSAPTPQPPVQIRVHSPRRPEITQCVSLRCNGQIEAGKFQEGHHNFPLCSKIPGLSSRSVGSQAEKPSVRFELSTVGTKSGLDSQPASHHDQDPQPVHHVGAAGLPSFTWSLHCPLHEEATVSSAHTYSVPCPECNCKLA